MKCFAVLRVVAGIIRFTTKQLRFLAKQNRCEGCAQMSQMWSQMITVLEDWSQNVSNVESNVHSLL